MDLVAVNKELKTKSPAEIVNWALAQGDKPVVTTNFRPYEAAILHAVTQQNKDVTVVWCDTGYNTNKTYLHANRLIEALGLKVKLYVPKQTSSYRDAVMGGIPGIDDPLHKEFTQQVKLEPFQRAMKENQPDIWFTNLRKGQTAFRDTLDIVSKGEDGVLKVSPFFYWSDQELDIYLKENQLENEFKYFDPTKVLENRECGLHIQ
ncbi:phosphoadenosine phosphosulfate reductase [Galbibacter marinus]|uniref:Phosphoadenosine phosphosulfate reductase n=1 Tax=Galbibacter marinus TaxID=555500 RepID=K2QGQ6_9FLAO|nr:phosphoadenosine phosphosulfate reductase family protein [Galbibacter marinus]EKF53872.1 phosphoadenosine phosphosulfate reductase [Galbibacter marinus]